MKNKLLYVLTILVFKFLHRLTYFLVKCGHEFVIVCLFKCELHRPVVERLWSFGQDCRKTIDDSTSMKHKLCYIIFQTSRIVQSFAISDGSWLHVVTCSLLLHGVYHLFHSETSIWSNLFGLMHSYFALMVWKFKFEKKLYNKILIWKRPHCFRDVRTVSQALNWSHEKDLLV